jgi:predicted transcriptional regulator
MSTKQPANCDEFSNETILQFIRAHEEPCITASEIAEEFGVTNSAVHYRVEQLEESNEIRAKEVGASATVFYLTS